jgi:drug/metabolite transporter (DMT)-like permease
LTPLYKRALSRAGLVYASLIWGSTFYLVKNLVREVPPSIFITYRFLLAALLCLPVLLIRKSNWIRGFPQGAVVGMFLWLGFAFQTYGLVYTTASNSGFITGLYVPLVSVFSVLFFRKAPTAYQWIAVVLSFVGLWLLTGGLKDLNRGDVLTLGTAVAIAFHILFSETYIRNQSDPITLAFHQFLVVGLLSLLFATAVGSPIVSISSKAWGQVFYMALFATVAAFLIQNYSQRHLDAVSVALIFTLEPVFAAIFSWTIGGETLVPSRALGGGLIVIAMIVSELRPQGLSGSGFGRSAL